MLWVPSSKLHANEPWVYPSTFSFTLVWRYLCFGLCLQPSTVLITMIKWIRSVTSDDKLFLKMLKVRRKKGERERSRGRREGNKATKERKKEKKVKIVVISMESAKFSNAQKIKINWYRKWKNGIRAISARIGWQPFKLCKYPNYDYFWVAINDQICDMANNDKATITFNLTWWLCLFA